MTKFSKAAILIAFAFCIFAIVLADYAGVDSNSDLPESTIAPEPVEVAIVPEETEIKAPARPKKPKLSANAKEARARQAQERELRSARITTETLPDTDSVSVEVTP